MVCSIQHDKSDPIVCFGATDGVRRRPASSIRTKFPLAGPVLSVTACLLPLAVPRSSRLRESWLSFGQAVRRLPGVHQLSHFSGNLIVLTEGRMPRLSLTPRFRRAGKLGLPSQHKIAGRRWWEANALSQPVRLARRRLDFAGGKQ